MKYFQKTIIASLIVTLVSFASGLCMHPMMAQASSDTDVNMTHDSSLASKSSCTEVSNDKISSKFICTSDCVTKVPQTTSAKKVTVDTSVQVSIVSPVDDHYTQYSELSFGAADSFGVHPPSPDILFSVFKRE